jgi:hypothetical protein
MRNRQTRIFQTTPYAVLGIMGPRRYTGCLPEHLDRPCVCLTPKGDE